MARTSDLDRVTAIVLRFMRGPILLLITVYGVGIAGMVLIPGQDAAGQPTQMSFFHAFYFMSYTATTTGFGEIPNEFSETQRMWAIVCLYMSVVAWVYAIGSIISLVQNPHFKQAMAQKRFALQVKRLSEPFVIIAGFGDTGSLLARGLSDQYMRGVVIDLDPERIKALGLRDYRVKMPGLCGDPGIPKTLLDAGLRHHQCQAVVALTNDEATNLKITVLVRLLNPSVQVICRSTSHAQKEELESLGRVTVVDPFETFANGLCAAIHFPKLYSFDQWMIGAHGAKLIHPLKCPMGTWILCGYGRMGRRVSASFKERGIPVVVIDPHIQDEKGIEHKIVGNPNRKTLIEAGIEQASGVIAATAMDRVNLEILITASTLNPRIFTVVRQHRHENEVAFKAGHVNLILQTSLATARRILLRLISPLIQVFIDHLQRHEPHLLDHVIDHLSEAVKDADPYLWTVKLSKEETSAIVTLCADGHEILLADLIRTPSDRNHRLDCVALVLKRAHQTFIMPKPNLNIQLNDEILFCGTQYSQRLLEGTLSNAYTLKYLITGTEHSSGYLMKWAQRRLNQRQSVSS